MINISGIKEALLNGNRNEYKLFPEGKDESILNFISNNELGKAMVKQINLYVKNGALKTSPNISFSMYKEFENTGNRLIFEKAYFERRKQLFSLVLAFIISKDKSYIPFIEEKLWEWCELYSWELPAHFSMSEKNDEQEPDKVVALFAAESAFFFAEILSIIGNDLDKFLVNRLKSEIFRRVINPYKNNSYWWENAKMNWSAVCAGSVGAAAIYLIDDIDELSKILYRVLKSMDAFIEAFDKDGLITEGLAYWSYGFSFFVYFAELLKDRTDGKISLLHQEDKIKKIAELPQILQFPSGEFVNFSDSGSENWYGDCGVFSHLQQVLDIKGYNYINSSNIYYDHTFRWAMMVRRLFWYNNINNNSNNTKTGDYYFSESQWLVDKRITQKGFSAFAAKGGNNDEPHNHNDLGNFILHHNGENIFIDIGSPEYVKQYFNNETRYDFIAASSLGHSVPVINNKAQRYGKEYYAKVLRNENKGTKTYFNLDLKNAYECDELTQYERGFIWDYEKLQLILVEKFNFLEDENEIKEVFITKIRPKMEQKGILIIYTATAAVQMEYPAELQCSIEECDYKDHKAQKSLIYRTIFIGKIDKSKEYIFKIAIL